MQKPPLPTDTLIISKSLRQSMTNAEQRLWNHLRNRRFENLKFRRQHPIPPYIVDFYCEDLNLIIELDGGQHSQETDAERTKFLQEKGYRVTRFWNNDMLANTEGVLIKLKEDIVAFRSHSLPGGEGNKTQKRILVGEIATVHGVRGLVKVRAFGDDAETLQKYGPLYTSEHGIETQTLTLKHQAGGAWIAEVDGITDRDVAAKLRGTQLWLDRDKLPEIEGAYYQDDLLGMTVVDQQGTILGIVEAIDNFGAGDLLDIKPEGKASFYLPFVDLYVLEIDEESGTITVDLPEGLIEP